MRTRPQVALTRLAGRPERKGTKHLYQRVNLDTMRCRPSEDIRYGQCPRTNHSVLIRRRTFLARGMSVRRWVDDPLQRVPPADVEKDESSQISGPHEHRVSLRYGVDG